MRPFLPFPTQTRHLLAAAAAAIAAVVVVSAAWPRPSWAWVALSIAYLGIELRWSETAGAGWVVAPAMAAAIEPGGAMLALVLAIGGLALVEWRLRRPALRSAATRIVGHVPLVAAFLVTGGVEAERLTWSVVVAGAVGGVIAFGSASLVRSLAGMRAAESDGVRAPIEHVVLGVAAALLGVVAHSVGWIVAPIVVAALIVIAATDAGRRESVSAQRGVVESLVTALEVKDVYTRGHSQRVAIYALWLGEELGLRGERLAQLRIAALLHDIGKLTVPRHVLRKPGALTPEETVIVQRHATVVPDILGGLDILEPVVSCIAEHHIHFDGSGYGRDGPRLVALSLESRILAVADAFDAMTTHRPYRMSLSVAYARGELRRWSGKQFDPDVVAAFERCLEGKTLPMPSDGFESDDVARRAAEGALDRA